MSDDFRPCETDDTGDEGFSRPSSLGSFHGQGHVLANLTVFVDAARKTSRALDHVLLSGPPGLGKTTLARIVASELGVGFRTVAAPAIEKASDIVSVLVGTAPRDVVFIDEIHRLPVKVEEVLYSAMEDFRLDVLVGEGPSARAVSIPLEPFTLVGATTRHGSLSLPFRERFGIPLRLELYTDGEMETVIADTASKAGILLEGDAAALIARRSRGTPRTGLRLLRRVRDFAIASGRATVSPEGAVAALARLGVDEDGLDDSDRRYLETIRSRFKGGPVGLSTLASALGESPETLEHSVEPFLIRKGLVDRTPRGRILRVPEVKSSQGNLFA